MAARVGTLLLGAPGAIGLVLAIDAIALFGVLATWLLVGGAASLWPGRPAAAVDPMTAWRQE